MFKENNTILSFYIFGHLLLDYINFFPFKKDSVKGNILPSYNASFLFDNDCCLLIQAAGYWLLATCKNTLLSSFITAD